MLCVCIWRISIRQFKFNSWFLGHFSWKPMREGGISFGFCFFISSKKGDEGGFFLHCSQPEKWLRSWVWAQSERMRGGLRTKHLLYLAFFMLFSYRWLLFLLDLRNVFFYLFIELYFQIFFCFSLVLFNPWKYLCCML